jgi:GTP cyclohydrolase I
MSEIEFGTRDKDDRIWNGHEFVSEMRFYQMGFLLTGERIQPTEEVPKMSGINDIDGLEAKMLIASLLRRIEGGNSRLREGLHETPDRVVKAFKHWFGGYDMDPAALLKTFEDGAQDCNEMVMVKDIPIYSKCEHHMADIFGTVTIAYIPNGKIVGLSKLSRLADGFARRLQVQERLTTQIADALNEHLKPKGVGVLIKARHMCMESRGICQQGHHTVTQALRGVILDEPATRAEFLALAR